MNSRDERRDVQDDLESVVGTAFETVTRRDESQDWMFAFAGHGGLSVACLWRVIAHGQLALASSDHGQAYGLPAPLDAAAKAQELVANRKIESVEVGSTPGDVAFNLEGRISLEILVDSSGFEAWEMNLPDGTMFVGRADTIVVFPTSGDGR